MHKSACREKLEEIERATAKQRAAVKAEDASLADDEQQVSHMSYTAAQLRIPPKSITTRMRACDDAMETAI